jgi:hypothetical protein
MLSRPCCGDVRVRIPTDFPKLPPIIATSPIKRASHPETRSSDF